MSAVAGVVTNVVTEDPQPSLIVALVALVAVGAALQMLISRSDSGQPVHAPGSGSVAVGGKNEAPIKTKIVGVAPQQPPSPPAVSGVSASGPGAVSVGGDNTGEIETSVEANPTP
ncbi:hypothetical protein [Streptomyces sp. NPDC005078]|uniref:hypothetical protein n=1 Tax=Streptomyces sp. NPDC005078 TaxID=3154293 RepID=UPI0033A4EA0D